MKFLNHLFSFNGRAGRMSFFIHNVGQAAVILGFFILVLNYEGSNVDSTPPPVRSSLSMLFPVLFLLCIVSEMSITVRRLHDLDQSGWMIFTGIIPIYNIIQGFRLSFEEGSSIANIYGLPPAEAKEEAAEKAEQKKRQKYSSPYTVE